MTDTIEAAREASTDPRDRSLVSDLQKLKEDGQAFAKAELAYQQARVGYAGNELRGITVSGVIAVVLLFFAAMALVLGLVLALTPLITAWGATAVVVLALLLAAYICAKRASARWQALRLAVFEKGKP